MEGKERQETKQNNDCDKPTNTRRSVQEKANPQLHPPPRTKKDEMKISHAKKTCKFEHCAVGDQGKRVNTDRCQIPPVPRSPDR
eukprot:scaffold26047_cov75-Skeletonema_dohrnii-CCMP3373.AAC.2